MIDDSKTMNNSTKGEFDSEDILKNVNLDMLMAVLPVTISIGIENIVGLIGNGLILLAYSRTYEKSNFRCFVLFMALIDLTSCLICVPGEIFSQLNWYKHGHTWICKMKSYFNVVGAWGSASILSLLAFDSYRKIRQPFASQIQSLMAFKLCLTAIIASAVVSALSTVLRGKQTYVYQKDDLRVKVTVCERSSLHDKKTSYFFMYTVFMLPIRLIMVIVTTLNILTTRKLFCKRRPTLAEPLSLSNLCLTQNKSQAAFNISTSSCSSIDDLGTRAFIETQADGCIRKDTELKAEATARRLSAEKTNCDQYGSKASVTRLDENDITLITDGSNTAPKHKLTKPWYTKTSCQSNELVSNTPMKAEGSRRSDVKPSSVSGSRRRKGHESVTRKKGKTIIMLVLTTAFNITMSLYVILVSIVAEKNALHTLNNSGKAIYFFFLHLYTL